MYRLLKGLRIVEGASFIAAPSCGLHLAQLGAEVIRFDMIGGGPDYRRWPLAPNGASLYWEGLNKGKKSIAVDLSRPEGRELVCDLITTPGDDRGLFVTNFPARGFLSYNELRVRRSDLILLRVMGRADGSTAVDYTINSTLGIPLMTGPASLGDNPVNHILPAWDLLAGAYGAFALTAAERYRRQTGQGQEITLPLDNLAIASLGNLGQIAETSNSNADRQRHGNDLFGAFGRDFMTADGRRIMLVAITAQQWLALLSALEIGPTVRQTEERVQVSFAKDEGKRFEHRELLNPIVENAIARRSYDDLAATFNAKRVCWGPYRTLTQGFAEDPALSAANPMLADVAHPSGLTYLTPGSPAGFSAAERSRPGRAPQLGEHTNEILSEVIGMSSGQIAALHDRGLVADAAPPA